MTIVKQQQAENQLPNEIKSVFEELHISRHLRSAGITKNLGFTCSYLFQIIFCLIFQHRSWFQLLESTRAAELPGKDTVYRFLNHPSFAWRRFLTLFSNDVIQKVTVLTAKDRTRVLIIDDSMYERNRSKSVELLARFKDHARGCYYKGFRMLTLGWSDGHTFLPVDFSLLSSQSSQIQGIDVHIDKRTCGYKRRQEALQSAPAIIPAMLDRALEAGICASYVLMDSWFTYAPLLRDVTERGLDAIGMVKDTNQRYQVGNSRLSLKQLYQVASPSGRKCDGILRVICTQMIPGLSVKIVFVENRTRKGEWLAILSTDVTISEEEIIRVYGMRWDIETFFKCTKSLLRLQKEFQGRSYDMLVSHTTIVFARYILLSWQHRQQSDERTLGGLFLSMCDELSNLEWAVALQQLLEILNDVSKKVKKSVVKLIKSQLQHWFAGLPSYIKAYLPNLCCES
ncbi:IS4 family transposase [Sporomusa sp.]|uniref:IS4 family transposase n=1 Tax=Sporomusa sp. TaxID=2078658 RepID=UPI002C90F2C8|nr:transposase [Sporomusa sp.]HWR09474.1 transposase [Sporomusa sp.]